MFIRLAVRTLLAMLVFYIGATVLAGCWLPDQLLKCPMPIRSEAQRKEIRAQVSSAGSQWTRHGIKGGEDVPLEVWWLHRPNSRGVAIILHGFGDDAWGSAGLANSLPDWDAVVFTFRGRDRHPAQDPDQTPPVSNHNGHNLLPAGPERTKEVSAIQDVQTRRPVRASCTFKLKPALRSSSPRHRQESNTLSPRDTDQGPLASRSHRSVN